MNNFKHHEQKLIMINSNNHKNQIKFNFKLQINSEINYEEKVILVYNSNKWV